MAYKITLDALSGKFIMVPKPSSGGALPTGGDEFAALEKQSNVDGDAAWTQPLSFHGISARFGNTQFDADGIYNVLAAIINIQYTPPLISLSGSSNILREKGDTVSSVLLTAAITKKSDPIQQVRFYVNPSTLIDTQNSGGAIPNGGNSTYTYSTPFSDNITFRAEVDDNGDTGGPSTVSSTTTYNFVYPYFDGVDVSDSLTAAQVATKTKRIINTSNNILRTFTASAGDYLYFAQPASYPALTNIYDENNFDVTSAWTSFTGNYTALDSSTQSLRVYRTINPVSAGSYPLRFTR